MTTSTSRRSFLRGALAGAAALTVTPLPVIKSAYGGVNAPDNGKFMVVVNLLGGNDGLNTVIPATLTPYIERRPQINLVENIPTGQVLHDLDANFKLHYAMDGCKSIWDDGQLQIINKVGYPNQNLSHFTSQNIYSFGVRDIDGNGDGRGWLGRFADTYCADPVEPLGVVSVGMGRRRDFAADVSESLVLNNVPSFDFDVDRDWRTDHDLRRRVARRVLETEDGPVSDAALTVFGTSRQAHELVERVQAGTEGWTDPGSYPTTTIGNRLKEVSRLLHGRADFKTKVFYTGTGGYDTHADQIGRHENLLTQLDDAIASFVADMKAKGLWDDCVLMVISEFGRRNFENGSVGTDHGHGNAFLVAGGPVDGGKITGTLSEADLNVNQPDFSYDFREVYADLIENHIGVSAVPIFPESFAKSGDINLVA
ncbi:MAG: DUF1501 domain-containing protein [Planctomycetota bacterium]|nr:DUF1501 domain-containing protein [Planctomycetota bacterium]